MVRSVAKAIFSRAEPREVNGHTGKVMDTPGQKSQYRKDRFEVRRNSGDTAAGDGNEPHHFSMLQQQHSVRLERRVNKAAIKKCHPDH